MAKLEIQQIPTRRDNYVYLFREPVSGKAGVVDPSDAAPVLAALDELGWELTHILNTHHHNDHTGGNLEIKERTGCLIVGPRADRDRIAGIDVAVADGDVYDFHGVEARVFDTPGHTRGHISYWFPEAKALFCGDTLFALGCGRLFEGTPEMMWGSLSKYNVLPDDTLVYCAHEYTQANARFALTIETDNAALAARAKEIDALRAAGRRTVPSTMGVERETNPFLRADLPSVQRAVGMEGAAAAAVFGEVRRRKDNF